MESTLKIMVVSVTESTIPPFGEVNSVPQASRVGTVGDLVRGRGHPYPTHDVTMGKI